MLGQRQWVPEADRRVYRCQGGNGLDNPFGARGGGLTISHRDGTGAEQAKQPGCQAAALQMCGPRKGGRRPLGPAGGQRDGLGRLIGQGGRRGGRKLTLEAKEATPAGELRALIGLLEIKRPTREGRVTEGKRSWLLGQRG